MSGEAGTDALAPAIHRALSALLGADLPLRIRCWDASEYAGPEPVATLVLRSPLAARHVLWSPGELGLARAYVTGGLDVEGDLSVALSRVRRSITVSRPGVQDVLRARSDLGRLLRSLRSSGALGQRPAPPPEEARLSGPRHTLGRDRSAISHHYDLGIDFYGLLLDDTMAYSCGVWDEPVAEPTQADGAAASHAKLDLICRKLDLRSGMHLLDVGCGWGSLLVHAATRFGVRATGVTISREQAAFVGERIARTGLDDRVEVRVQDYRELEVTGVDAVASVEMGEHVGERQYPEYVRIMFDALRPGGRLLLQQMSREAKAGGGAFIESYIAPDMHMRPLDATCAMLTGGGFEIRDVEGLREHYVLTVRAWAHTLEQRWDDVVALAGERTARIWRLYLAGGGLAFAENRMGVDQILAVRPHPDGSSGMPLARAAHVVPDA